MTDDHTAENGTDSQAEDTSADQDAVQQSDAKDDKESSLPDFNVTVEDIGTLRKKVTIEVPRERIDAKFENNYGELMETAQVPGFRVGRAPRRLVEKRFKGEVSDQVRLNLIAEGFEYALETTKLKILHEDDPDLDSIKLPDEGSMTYSTVVEVRPDITLPELDGIALERSKVEVDDEQINNTIERLQRQAATYEPVEEPAAEDDRLTGSLKITVDGVDEPFEDTESIFFVRTQVVQGLRVDNFAELATGKKSGDTITAEVDVPDDHVREEWQGKKATIEFTISQVGRLKLPEIDDELAKVFGQDTMDDLKEYIRDNLEDQAEETARYAMFEQLRSWLIENIPTEVPENLSQRQIDRAAMRRLMNLRMQGEAEIDIDKRMDELRAEVSEDVIRQMKLQFIISAIAEEREVEVSDAEINGAVASMAMRYGQRPERMKQQLQAQGSLDMLEADLQERKVLQQLLEKANISDTEVTEQGESADTDSDSAAPQ